MRKLIIITSAASLGFLLLFFFIARAEQCNTRTVFLNGQLTTDADGWLDEEGEQVYNVSSRRLAQAINDIAEEKKIKAFILDVDSNGGSVVAAEEIFDAIAKLEIPTAAVVGDGSFSAAYTAMSGADKIFLKRSSQVGAIGVTGSYLQKYEKNLKEGIIFQELTSAKFKDLLNPNKQLTTEEKRLIQGIIDDLHANVVATIAEGRHMTVGEVGALADGSIYVGEKAIAKKLADNIGGIAEAKEYLKGEIGKEIKICE
ncbi:MAG: S49 family peptidase [Patescibacteria group bacterium]